MNIKNSIILRRFAVIFICLFCVSHSFAVESETVSVIEVQRKLSGLNYRVGKLDGIPGSRYRNAITAFQKMNNLKVTGKVNKALLNALQDPITPEPRHKKFGYQTEVDTTKQVLVLYLDNKALAIVSVSTGKESTPTPLGMFEVVRKIPGAHHPVKHPDWVMYDPVYFHLGYAIHGEEVEPPIHPASHGCVRIPKHDSSWYYSKASIGDPILIF